MASRGPTRVVFIWHMHQPSYRSPLTGRYVLPWVLVHGMRDYYDMPKIAGEVEGVGVTVNLVPGMVEQLEEYASGKARDVFWDLAEKNPDDLEPLEKEFLLQNFVNVHEETMLRPHPRFAELAYRAQMAGDRSAALKSFSRQDWLDLQLWFFLAWTGGTLREDPRVAALFNKGLYFTQDDKSVFRQAVSELLADILPLHRRLVENGSIEVACSPMYHPILPLLVHQHSALEAAPDMRLPSGVFSYPADAALHVRRGLDTVSQRLGRRVVGMWPSEGSVSTPVLNILTENRVEWIATDEGILFGTLGESSNRARALYRPWKVGGTAIFFRDTRLSDLIGFVYSRWKPEQAVDHFAEEVHRSAMASGLDDPVVTIAMDGENAWEHYVHGGMRFVELLYKRLAGDERFRLVTPSQVLSETECRPLDGVRAGSWIGGTFHTWMGDPVKNLGWDYLLAARQAAEETMNGPEVEPELRDEVTDLVMRAEASDWFWWFGEGHTSPYDAEFDLLFRHHLKAIYAKLGMHPPTQLDEPLDPAQGRVVASEPPVHLISPRITGRQDNYYKWLSAGRVSGTQGFVHRPVVRLREVRFGFDEQNIVLRVETDRGARKMLETGCELLLHVVRPTHRDFRVGLSSLGGAEVDCMDVECNYRLIEVAVETFVELRIPFDCLGDEDHSVGRGSWVELYLVLVREGLEEERFPETGNVVFKIRGEELNAENWHV